MRVRTTDDSLVVYENRDFSSTVIAKLAKDTILELGSAEESDGRAWIAVTIENGRKGYVLSPSARGHTTLGANLPPTPPASRLAPGTSALEPKASRLARGTGAPEATKDARGWLFRDEDSARDEKNRWESLLPKQKTAYRPSGKVAPVGLVKLLTAGMAAGSLFTFMIGLAGTLIFGYTMAFSPRLGVFADPVSTITGFLGLGFIFTGPGLAAAAGVGAVSHGLKNRSVIAEGLVAAASSIIGWFVFCKWSLPSISRSLLDALPPEPQGAFTATRDVSGFLLLTPFGVVVFAIFAFRSAAERVRQAKFCEPCEQHMGLRRVGCLSLKGALDFISVAKDGRLAGFRLEKESTFAPAELAVFTCDTCSAGYVEISVNFRADYLDDRSWRRSVTAKTWLAFSAPTTSDLSSLYDHEDRSGESANSEAAAT